MRQLIWKVSGTRVSKQREQILFFVFCNSYNFTQSFMPFVYKAEYALDVLHNSFLTASYFEMKC